MFSKKSVRAKGPSELDTNLILELLRTKEAENNILKKVGTLSITEKKWLTEKGHPVLTIKDQCDLLSIPRSTLYYKNVPISDKNELIMRVMRVMDRIFTANPFYGYRKMTALLNRLLDTPGDMELIREKDIAAWPFTPDNPINEKRTRRLYRVMGIEAYPFTVGLGRAKSRRAEMP
ncbi:MAG: IS3 family transposase [Deltaproteobacteria bacterium]|jgi:putative transposase|nr:IS3 family transposase [Deltaproteobacteria bacterium]